MSFVQLYREVWLVDFEFQAIGGERPRPLCLVAYELHSKQLKKIWLDDEPPTSCPFAVDEQVLFVAFYASAELGCFLSLGWVLPERILDLYTEQRSLTNAPRAISCSLLGAMHYYGLDAIDAAEKTEFRDLAMRGGPYTSTERSGLLDYCESDVLALHQLLLRMMPQIDFPRALLRGRFMAAVSRMEHTGIPLDLHSLSSIRESWNDIKLDLIAEVDKSYGVFEGTRFSSSHFERYLSKSGIPWPRLPSGRLRLDDGTFREQARRHPRIAALRELKHTLGQLKLENLQVGSDGRNRCLLSPFRSVTSRCQPSNAKFIFGPSVWLRSLIKPQAGRAMAYIDWSQQELGIAAALSDDPRMKEAYLSGDPYLEFAKQAGAVPAAATKASHPEERSQYKICSLAVQYGMGAASLANLIGLSTSHGRSLLRAHMRTYRRFWDWSDEYVQQGFLRGDVQTVFGWRMRITQDTKHRTVANFPMQANGAEMLRLACCLATERGMHVCAPVHDAVLIEDSVERITDTVNVMQDCMAEASRIVLGGFELRSDSEVFRYPARYIDESRGREMWNRVQKLASQC